MIAAYAQNRVIGCRGQIPWSIPGEQSRFRELTTGKTVIMGRRTYEEIGRPLPNRKTILVSRTLDIQTEQCTTVPTLAEALKIAEGDVFVSGGEMLYKEALPLADVLYLTEIHADIEGDRYFPLFDRSEFTETVEQEVDGELPFTYKTYRRIPMSYTQTVDYVAGIQKNSGIVLGLQPLRELLARLGHPQDKTKFIHLAGTNGKGSVGAMLSCVLTQAGYRTGHYSSPAVFDPMECWKIDGIPISQEQYARRMTKIAAHREAMKREGLDLPTAFELETALAFLTFAEEQVDLAVLECGMGGAEDATNVITTTVLSLLTSIGLDHTKFLGGTLAEITRTKSGIIKPGVPCVLQGQETEVVDTVRALCAQRHSRLICAESDRIVPLAAEWDKNRFVYKEREYTIALLGRFQQSNAAQVIDAVEVLRQEGYAISGQALRRGLEQTMWHGRMEIVAREPAIILDGAHNPDAAKCLRETLKTWKQSDWQGDLYLIMGVLADKDFSEVCAQTVPYAKRVFTVTPNNPRALSAQALADCVKQYCAKVQPMSIHDAVRTAVTCAKPQDRILVFGSLSYLKEVRQEVKNWLGEHK